ncbi:hypothetical protein BDQ17DRAFT_1429626 [Cyathus striatus]|nr:hypothetical protein BDQ17DRAFT_1429626 [Cyathus striatus]
MSCVHQSRRHVAYVGYTFPAPPPIRVRVEGTQGAHNGTPPPWFQIVICSRASNPISPNHTDENPSIREPRPARRLNFPQNLISARQQHYDWSSKDAYASTCFPPSDIYPRSSRTP